MTTSSNPVTPNQAWLLVATLALPYHVVMSAPRPANGNAELGAVKPKDAPASR
jgi:hypothetical protein